MPYDALGNYVPGDEPTYTQKKPARGLIPDPAYMQIPTPNPAYGNVPNVDEMRMALSAMKAANFKDPLAKTHKRFAELQADIAELPKQLSDVTNTLFGNPMQMMVRTPIEAMLRRQTSTPELNALLEKNMAPMQTRGGEEFASNVGKAFEASKLPPWPMRAGMVESVVGMPQRPMFEPSDLRALSGDAARLATQIGDVVPDFQAAQTGFKRMDPVTGKPTVGAQAQALMDDWANVLERRQTIKDEVSPFAEATSPEMYAMRKKGTKLIEPAKPETSTGAAFSVDPAYNIVRETVGSVKNLPPYEMYREWRNAVADDMPPRLNDEMRKYATTRKAAAYPELTPSQAVKAFDLEFTDKDANAAKLLEFFTDYLTSPEGQALAQQAGFDIVTPAQFAERHAAALDWLHGPYSNYIVRNIGIEGDPLVDLAAKGLTYMPARDLQELAVFAEPEQMKVVRENAGLPREGTVGLAAKAKMAEFEVAQQELQAMEQRRAELYAQAQAQSIDPASIPEYAALTTPVRNKGRQVQQLENEIKNLQTGVAYEALTDLAVMPRSPQEFLGRDIDEYETPFYPAASKAGPNETIYAARERMLKDDLGFGKIAKDFYKDVIAGNITPEQLKNLTVPKYVGKRAEQRVIKEAQQEKERAVVKNRVLDTAKEQLNSAQMYLPNASVIEITSAMTPEEIAKFLSVDTTVLNHCVGTCGTPPEGTRNLFTNDRQGHKSLFDFEKNDFAKISEPLANVGYVRAILAHNDQISSIRDPNTGLPVATIQFDRLQNGKFSLGYVSGYGNGKISPQYSADIAQYLNYYADQLADTGQLAGNAGVFDTTQHNYFKTLAHTAVKETGVPLEVIRSMDPLELPRFVTQDQFNDFVMRNNENVPPTTAPEVIPDDPPAPDVIPPEYLNDPEQLLAYGERRLHDLDTINREMARYEYAAVHRGLTEQERESYATLQANQAEFRAIVSAVNTRLEQLRAQPEQLPAQLPEPPELVNIGDFEIDWDDPANFRATLEVDQSMPTQIVNMDNTRLLQFLTPIDFQDASSLITHIQDQLHSIEEDALAENARATPETMQQEYIEYLRDDPGIAFGDMSPYVIEYAIRVVEGRMGNPRQIGFAKGGTVRIAKTIPAMRAELRRT